MKISNHDFYDGPYTSGLNPINPDTDGDTLPDAYEIQYNLNPQKNNKTQDTDNDGLNNYQGKTKRGSGRDAEKS